MTDIVLEIDPIDPVAVPLETLPKTRARTGRRQSVLLAAPPAQSRPLSIKCIAAMCDVVELSERKGWFLASRTWEVLAWNADHPTHIICLEHSELTGSRVVTINGTTVVQDRDILDNGSEHSFEYQGEKYSIVITALVSGFQYEISINGTLVDRHMGAIPEGACSC